ncbi:MAG: hypothetical protein QOJ82_2607 [Solirubrobacteraceae bacterium]|jgi:hypothetical protein|nr:hypothetical protein [Solirubrobacteraceae bacterium]
MPERLHQNVRGRARHVRTIARVDEDVVTRELSFDVGALRRGSFRRELQQVCVELGCGCDVEEQRRLLSSRFRVLVRGKAEDVDALLDYARISGWSTATDDEPLGDALES